MRSMTRSLSLLPKLVATLAVLSSSFGVAQTSSVLPRINAQIDDTKLTKIAGNVAGATRTASDLGQADSSTQLTHLRLVLSRSPQQEQAMNQYAADLQDKTSPNYHKWLTPEQFGKLYGPADSDISAIVAWLESRGLKVEDVPPGRTHIAFSGTVEQVESALHVQIHSFQGRTQTFYSNIGDPSIPTALASVVSGIAHLSTLRPTPHHIANQMGKMDASTKRLVPVGTNRNSKLGPNLTSGSGTTADPYFLYIVPGDAATIYDTPNTTLNANYTSGTSYTGTGVTIGIGGDAAISATTVGDFRKKFLNSSSTVAITYVDNVTSTNDADEAYIDTELSGGMAPGASLHYYASTDLFSAIDKAISDNTVDIFSLSFGECELGFSTADNTANSMMWQQAAMQGIAITVSTGDSGAAGCDATADNNGNNIPDASYGLAVNGLASTPYNLAVGGTDMDGLLNTSTFTTYVSSTESTSATLYRSALKYIPESTWNDSTQADGKISANLPYTGANANIVGGSGGKSDCSTNTTPANEQSTGTCTSGYAKPSWQRGTGVPSDSVRDLPDISMMAGNAFDPATWLICTDDSGDNGSGVTVTANCTTQSDNNFYFQGFGGTSTAAPAFAGILALVQQKNAGRLGQAAVELYDLYNGSHASAIFHDITIGNNSVACNVNTPNCSKNTAGNYYLTGYDTTAGYDLATGIGSVDANQLVTYWGTGLGVAKPTVKVTPSASSVASTASLAVAVSVTGSATSGDGATVTPTGTVTLTSGTYTSSAGTLSSTGAFNFTIPAGSLATGSDTLTVNYSGDVNFASASGTSSVTVTVTEPAGATFALGAAAVTVAPGGSGTSAITATTTNGYFGTITLSNCTLTTSPTGASNSPTCSITASSITLASGSTTATGGTVTINTTGATTNAIKRAQVDQTNRLRRWTGVGGLAIAGILFFGIPARNRKWRSVLGAFAFLAILGFASGCGGGGSSGGGGTTNPGTTAGTYTFTVTGTDAATKSTANATITVTVS